MIEHRLAAGGGLRLCFAGEALVEQVMAPLEHLVAPAADAAATLFIWDTESTGVAPPQPPWALGDLGPLGVLPAPHVGLHDPGAGRMTIVDKPGARAYSCWAASALPWYERGAPLRPALQGLLAESGTELIHAGAVGLGGRGALIGGISGAGKTTLALACLEAGMQYAGDDYVLLAFEPEPVAYALYLTAKTVSAKTVSPHGPEKTVVNVGGERMTERLPITALVLPQRTAAARPRLTRLSRAAGLLGLAPSSVLQATAARDATMRAAATLVRAVPSYTLECTADSAANVGPLRELLGA